MERNFDAYILKYSFDTVVPLNDGTYPIKRKNVKQLYLSINNNFTTKPSAGSFQIGNNTHFNSGHGQGSSTVELAYVCQERLTAKQFAENLGISPIWDSSPTGWDFALHDINRIIDCYKYFAHSYWWQHLTMWNVDELKIFGGLNNGEEIVLLSLHGSPKITKAGNKPLDECAYNQSSTFLEHVCNGRTLPFYFLLYLNGRKSFAEHSYREALVYWANSIEAFAIYLLEGSLKKTSTPEADREAIYLAADTFQKRYSKAYEALAQKNIFPSLRKKAALRLISDAMEFRNTVMHGNNPDLSWSVVSTKQSAVEEIINIAAELSL